MDYWMEASREAGKDYSEGIIVELELQVGFYN
jgi:hypothetical protein